MLDLPLVHLLNSVVPGEKESQILPLFFHVFPRERPHWLPVYYPQRKLLLSLIWPSIAMFCASFAHMLLLRDYHKPWKIPKFSWCFEWMGGLGCIQSKFKFGLWLQADPESGLMVRT